MVKHGQDAEAIRDAMGLATASSVYYGLRAVDTLLQCKRSTKAPVLASQRARLIRSFVRRHDELLSSGTKKQLDDLASEHERVAEDEKALAVEARENEAEGEGDSGRPGIYVYTLPHYMKYPVKGGEDVDRDSNPRTYLKVGMSNVDADSRIRNQASTALPEPPLVLRRYVLREENVNYRHVEAKIHKHLEDADHNPNRQTGAGREWFLTHLTLLDSTARLLRLEIEYEDDNHPSALKRVE